MARSVLGVAGANNIQTSGMTFPTNFSFVCRLQTDHAVSSASAESAIQIMKLSGSALDRFELHWNHSAAGQEGHFGLKADGGSFFYVEWNASAAANTLYRIGCTYNGSTFRAFLDGSFVESVAMTDVMANDTACLLMIGEGRFNRPTDIDYVSDVAFWGVAMSDAVMESLTASPQGADPMRTRPDQLITNLPIYGRESPEPDRSGNGIAGTVTGTAYVAHQLTVARRPLQVIASQIVPTPTGPSIPVVYHHRKRNMAA